MSELNSFSALGFPDDEAVVAALRADLAGIIRGYIQRAQGTQTAIARRLGIPQSTVSAILNDNVERLSLEYFLRILARLKLPWTAKCWNSPHDAQWILGSVSQLMSVISTSQRTPQAVSERDIWSNSQTLYCGLSTTGNSQTPSKVISAETH